MFLERCSELVIENLFLHFLSSPVSWFLVIRNIYLEVPLIRLQILSSGT